MTRPHVVIIGGGFGGLEAARKLKRAPVRVTLIDRNNHHTFVPLLYQAATSGLESNDVAFPLRKLLRRHKNTDVLMAEVESIEPKANQVHLNSGRSLTYDYLILAAGAQSFYFGHPEYRAYAPGLKSVADALVIRFRVLSAFECAEQTSDPAEQRALLTFVVVGGGPTGVELSGAIAELAKHALKRDFRHIDPTRAKILLVEGGPNVLPTYPPDLQAKAKKQLESLGVEVRTSARVHAVDEYGAVVENDRILARTVLWGAGVMGSPIARSLGTPLDRHGRVTVNSTLNPLGLPNVFVVGDVASLVQDGKPVPGVATAAIQGGRYAARSIIKQLQGKPIGPFRYWDKGEIATIGRSRAVAMVPHGIKLSGFLAWIFYLGVHLFYLTGFNARVRVLFSWFWSYLTWSRGARLIPARLPEEVREPAAAEPKPAPAPVPEPHPPAPQPH